MEWSYLVYHIDQEPKIAVESITEEIREKEPFFVNVRSDFLNERIACYCKSGCGCGDVLDFFLVYPYYALRFVCFVVIVLIIYASFGCLLYLGCFWWGAVRVD